LKAAQLITICIRPHLGKAFHHLTQNEDAIIVIYYVIFVLLFTLLPYSGE